MKQTFQVSCEYTLIADNAVNVIRFEETFSKTRASDGSPTAGHVWA